MCELLGSCSDTCCNNLTYTMNCNKPVTPTRSQTRSVSKQRERRDFVPGRLRESGRSAGWTAASGRVWPPPPLLRGHWTWHRDAAAPLFAHSPQPEWLMCTAHLLIGWAGVQQDLIRLIGSMVEKWPLQEPELVWVKVRAGFLSPVCSENDVFAGCTLMGFQYQHTEAKYRKMEKFFLCFSSFKLIRHSLVSFFRCNLQFSRVLQRKWGLALSESNYYWMCSVFIQDYSG